MKTRLTSRRIAGVGPRASRGVSAAAAMATLDAFMEALNRGDERALNEALNFPHVRLASGRVTRWETRGSYRLADFLAWAGDFASALQAGLRALAIGEAQADIAIQVVANGYLGVAYVGRGEHRKGIWHCEAALALIPEGLGQERFGQGAMPGSWVRDTLARGARAVRRRVRECPRGDAHRGGGRTRPLASLPTLQPGHSQARSG